MDALDDIDIEAKVGLLGNDSEQQGAIALLLRNYFKPLMGFLKNGFPSLSEHERLQAIHDALIAIYENAESMGNDDKPFAPFLFTVSKWKAISILRKASVRVQTDDELTEEIGNSLKGTATGHDWERLKSLELAKELQIEFRSFVATLSGQQLRVASVLADNLASKLSDSEIASEIFERTKTHITTIEVKGAKAALMKKFRTLMEHKLKS